MTSPEKNLDEVDEAILAFVRAEHENGVSIPQIHKATCKNRTEEFARYRVKKLHRRGLVEMVKFFGRVIVLPAGALDTTEEEVTVE